MKRLLLVALIGIMLSGCASTKVYIMGVDVKEAVKAEDIVKMGLGAAASVAAHVAGHYIAGEFVGADIRQDFDREIITNPQDLTASDWRWFARGGFAFQALVNTALTSFEATRTSFFTRGFTLMTIAENFSYRLRRPDDGDVELINRFGGNGDMEFYLYSGMSLWNMYRINKDVKGDLNEETM